jgi:phosphoglycerate dehydrogenase-like enzyme
MTSPFRIALTADFYDAAGRLRYLDIGADLCADRRQFHVDRFAEHRHEIEPQQLAGYNGVVVLSSRVTARSLSEAPDLLAIGRFGVGYDSVDVAACTAADVLLFITVGAVDYSVAEATVGWMLALAHHVRAKDHLVREARWDERSGYMGCELRGRTLGIVGFGGIGRAVVKLLSGFGMNPPLVFDPFAAADSIAAAGARSVSLEELLGESDFVSLHCPLNESTRGLIGADQLRLMKPTAYLINTARGGIVDEEPLYQALKSRRIAGAAIDCFASEPLTTAPKLAELENVLLAPHCIAWTNELFRDIGRAAFQGMIDLAAGRKPRGMVNPEVLQRPGFQQKWRQLLSSANPLR